MKPRYRWSEWNQGWMLVTPIEIEVHGGFSWYRLSDAPIWPRPTTSSFAALHGD